MHKPLRIYINGKIITRIPYASPYGYCIEYEDETFYLHYAPGKITAHKMPVRQRLIQNPYKR